jgi:hypothetical protein
MPLLRTYRLFISHVWHRSEHYQRVIDWLNEAPNFRWENLSVPEHAPVSVDTLEYSLRNQMRDADAFIILAGMYSARSEWIDFELNFARRIGHPIIGVAPWGQERMPAAVLKAATEVVRWNAGGIVDAIRRNAKPSAP